MAELSKHKPGVHLLPEFVLAECRRFFAPDFHCLVCPIHIENTFILPLTPPVTDDERISHKR